MARSRKENERRLPLHPHHLDRIPDDLRESIYLETGYGDRFGLSDDQLEPWVAGFRTREQLVEECDVILLPKPLLADIAEMRDGQVLWGWPHCVQDAELTQLAIDQRLTLIAFEAMNHWTPTARSACTCSTRTTSWPATARCCTPCSSRGRPATTAVGCAPSSSASARPPAVR